jgi:hypothetical protein
VKPLGIFRGFVAAGVEPDERLTGFLDCHVEKVAARAVA